ncbi:MAG: M13 family peptidase, partial [Acidobacteriaceae bacterium]|nr:M13 family peptidase [Acidobacteriaceae bacterium]
MTRYILPAVLALPLLCLGVFAQAPPSSGVDLSAIDSTINPCQDFYQYACGNWIKNNPVPAAYGRWGRFNELQDRNEETLRDILEDSGKHTKRSAIDQKI